MIKNNKGITLTALVITVIVLIILSVIIVLATSSSNITGEATDATKQFEDATVKQILDNIYLSERNKYNSGLISENEMWTNIKSSIIANNKLNFSIEDIPSGGIKVKIDGELKYKITLANGIEVI